MVLCCKALNVKNEHHHRAVDDANATAKIFVKLYEMLVERGVKTVEDVNELGSASDDTIKKGSNYYFPLPRKHICECNVNSLTVCII